MLRLPRDVLLGILLKQNVADLHALQATCRHLRGVLDAADSLLRLYLAQHAARGDGGGSGGGGRPPNEPGVAAVYNLALWRRLGRCASSHASLRLVRMMLDCAALAKAADAQQDAAIKSWQAAADARGGSEQVAAGVQLLLGLLPHADHCLLPFFAHGGHIQLVRALLPLLEQPAGLAQPDMLQCTSAFLAAAAGGQGDVLSELLAAGASSWACQLPGPSLASSALDLAAQGGHAEAMRVLRSHVTQPSASFLAAAAGSGSSEALELALELFFGQFNAHTGFCTGHVQQMHTALRVACEAGDPAAIRLLLRHLHAVRCHDCCVLALGCTGATGDTPAMRCVLDSPYFAEQLQRRGRGLLEQLAVVLGSCLRIAIRTANAASLRLLLDALCAGRPLFPARPLLAPQMPSVFDEAAAAGSAEALHSLLTLLPEHFHGLGASALTAALAAGHRGLAGTVRMLLLLRGAPDGFTPEALSEERSPAVARAARQGALRAAARDGDADALRGLLGGGEEPGDGERLLLLRLAAGAGHQGVVRLLLQLGEEAGGPADDSRQHLRLAAVWRGAVAAGQLGLLQVLADDVPSLLHHLASQAEAVGEYLRAALLCKRVEVASWLVQVAAQQQQLGSVRATLASLLTASRWELANTGLSGTSAREVVVALLKSLADAPPPSPRLPHSRPPSAAPPPLSPRAVTPGGGTAGAAQVARSLVDTNVLQLLLHTCADDPRTLLTVVELVGGLDGQPPRRQPQPPQPPQLSQQHQPQHQGQEPAAQPSRQCAVCTALPQRPDKADCGLVSTAGSSGASGSSNSSSSSISSSSYLTVASTSSSQRGSSSVQSGAGGKSLPHAGAAWAFAPAAAACDSGTEGSEPGSWSESPCSAAGWLRRADGAVHVGDEAGPHSASSSGDLRQLLGKVQRLSVSPPERLEPMGSSPRKRPHSEPGALQGRPAPQQGGRLPLQAMRAASLPVPRPNQQPLHPFMVGYHEQRQQQQQQQQQQPPADAVAAAAGAAAGCSRSPHGATTP